jgi:hypothetical protein
VADLTFSQPARRNLLLPVALALAVLAAAVFLILRYTPHTTADLSITGTAVYPVHTVFKSDSIVVGRDQAQDDLYIFVNLRIVNRLRLPLFLKDFTATLTPAPDTPGGSLPLTSSALEKQDIPTLYATFPAIGKLAAQQNATPLLRETRIDPGQTAQGFVLLHFSTTKLAWDKRQSASLTVDLYHQAPITIDIPASTPRLPGR